METKRTPIRTYRDLKVFQDSYQLALTVSRLAKMFPQYEQFELGRQLRRSARSIPANIVEGWAKRSSGAEFKRYLQVAIGSCEETKFWLQMGNDEEFVGDDQFRDCSKRLDEIGAMLYGLWRQWKSK